MLPSAVMSPAAPKKGKTVAETMAVNGSEASPGATPTESTSQDPSSLPCNLVTINVGGLRYQTYAETLEKYPDTLLGDPVRRKPFFNQVKQMESLAIIAYDGGKLKTHRLEDNSCRGIVWNFLEYSDSSICARLFAFISIFVILLSTVSFCLETVPKFKHAYAKFDNETSSINTTSGRQLLLELEIIGIDWSNPFSVIDFVCTCWFSCEFVLRLIFCPNKRKFCTNLLNIIDLVAIVPFYVNLLLENESWFSLIVLRIVRLVRVFRVFKLSRYSNGLRILGKTIKASLEELFLLLFFMMIALVIFSTAIYCVEDHKNFESIPEAFWFTIATMTTVGYGDLTPKRPLGKLVGGLCAILGVLILALPAPVIVANFKCYYDQQKRLSLMHPETEDSKDQESTSKSG